MGDEKHPIALAFFPRRISATLHAFSEGLQDLFLEVGSQQSGLGLP